MDENGHCLFPGDRLWATVWGMQEAGGAGAASVWTQQARAAGSWRGARHHSNTRKHHRGGGHRTHARDATSAKRKHRHITRGSPDSHPPAPGPHPAVATHTGAGHGAERPPPPPATAHGLFGLEAPETAPLPGRVALCPPGVFPAERTLRRRNCPWGPPPATRPPRDQEHSSLQIPQEFPQHQGGRGEGWERGRSIGASGSPFPAASVKCSPPHPHPPAPSLGPREAKRRSPATVAGKSSPAVRTRAWASCERGHTCLACVCLCARPV